MELAKNGSWWMKANTDGSKLQRSLLIDSLRLHSNKRRKLVKGVKKLQQKELKKARKLAKVSCGIGILSNPKEEVLFFYGDAKHQPSIPIVDCKLEAKQKQGFYSKKRKPRRAKTLVVHDVEGLEVYDADGGCICEGVFVRCPEKSLQEGLYEELAGAEERQKSQSVRSNTEGQRIMVSDGKKSGYAVLGNQVNRQKGGGMHYIEDEMLYGKVLKKWLAKVDHNCKSHCPRALVRILTTAKEKFSKEVKRQTLGDSMFPSLAFGRNVFLNMHTDKDYGWSVTTVVANDSDIKSIVCYFVFARKGIAVALRHGDVLFFNAQEAHCVSARCNPDRETYCMSLYMKGEYGSGNQKVVERSLTDEENKNAARAALEMKKKVSLMNSILKLCFGKH